MRLPRDLAGAELIKRLARWVCVDTAIRQPCGLTSTSPSEHHITIPLHDPLRVGTLAAILSAVAIQRGLTRDELITQLFS